MYSVLGLGITKACIFIFRDEYTCKFFYHVYVYLSLSIYIYMASQMFSQFALNVLCYLDAFWKQVSL